MSATGQAVHSIQAALELFPVLFVQGVSHCPGAGFEGQKVRPTCEGQGWRGLSQAQSLVVPPPALTLKWNVTMGSPVGQKRSQQRRSRHAHGDRSVLTAAPEALLLAQRLDAVRGHERKTGMHD